MSQLFFFNFKKPAMLLFILLHFIHSNGQVCSASYTDQATNLTQSVTNYETSNDVWTQDNCVDFRVWVNETDISWIYNDACGTSDNGIIDIVNSGPIVINPDVAIVYDNSDDGHVYYALVVYFYSGKYYYRPFYIDASGDLQPFSSPVQLYVNSGSDPVDNGIRIDANSHGDFVIVLNDIGNSGHNFVKTIAGRINPGAGPILAVDAFSNPLVVDLPYVPTIPPVYGTVGDKPDVAIEELPNDTSERVYYTFLSPDHATLVVTYQLFDDIYNNTMTTSFYGWKEDCNPGYPYFQYFERPRIACPGSVNYDFTVVWARYDGYYNLKDILGLTYNAGTNNDYNYTDNSGYQFWLNAITVTQNAAQTRPSVSYGFNVGKDVAQVAWHGGWIASPPAGTGTTTSAIALSLNIDGSVAPNCISGKPCFKELTYTGHHPDYPSVAGRHASYNETMNVCWSVDDPDVLYKDFQWCDEHYRNIAPSNINAIPVKKDEAVNFKSVLYPNPSSAAVKLNLSSLNSSKTYSMIINDIAGRTMLSISGVPSDLEGKGEKIIRQLKTGFYTLNVYGKNSIILTKKIIRL